MKQQILLTIFAVASIGVAGAPFCATAQTARAPVPGARAPASLISLPRCVWGKLKAGDRKPLLMSTETNDTAGIEGALTEIKADTLLQARACSPSIDHDASTGDAVLLAGLPQEAAADLLNRDLKLTRVQLDHAVAAAPAALTADLRKAADNVENKRPVGALPPLDPIVAALHRPAGSAALTARQSLWLQVYVLGHFEVRAAADSYDPNPKL